MAGTSHYVQCKPFENGCLFDNVISFFGGGVRIASVSTFTIDFFRFL